MSGASTDSVLLPPGTRVGRYALVRRLGVGGMGAVYEGIHEDLGKRVAIKLLHPQIAESSEARARFLREGQALARIRHPHVAEVFDVGQEATGLLYLVMELLEGESLGALLSRRGALRAEELADIMVPLCAAVDAAHRAGIIHRDLKPDNIFLSRDAHAQVVPKVLDFGISKVPHAPGGALTGTQRWMGTPQYMSPEQAASGKAVDARTDIYALGVVLYECVCGVLPYPDDDLFPLLCAIVEGEFPPPRAQRPDLSTEMEAVILRAMATSPDARFEDAMSLGRALLPFASLAVQSRWAGVFADSERTRVQASPVRVDASPTISDARTLVTPDLSATTLAPRVPESAAKGRRVGLYVAAGVTAALVLIAVALPSERTGRDSPPAALAAPSPPTVPDAGMGAAVERVVSEDAGAVFQAITPVIELPRDAGSATVTPRALPAARRNTRTVGANRAPIVE